jgi:hypothetical protein
MTNQVVCLLFDIDLIVVAEKGTDSETDPVEAMATRALRHQKNINDDKTRKELNTTQRDIASQIQVWYSVIDR